MPQQQQHIGKSRGFDGGSGGFRRAIFGNIEKLNAFIPEHDSD